MSQEPQDFQNINNSNSTAGAAGSNNNLLETSLQLATFETAIAQLQRLMESGMNSGKAQAQLPQQDQIKVLIEKYEKIEQLVLVEQESIEEAMAISEDLQHQLNEEYSLQQKFIAQGKRDILQLSLVNKQALQFQNAGQKTLQRKQVEAEGLVQQIMKLQKDCQALSVIINDKQAEEARLDATNEQSQIQVQHFFKEKIRKGKRIAEFRQDQQEQKDGLTNCKVKIEQGEKQAKNYRKEQQELTKKYEGSKRACIEVQQRTAQWRSQLEVVNSELRNEKRTLAVNEKKYEEISRGLASIQDEIEKSNAHLEQVRGVNAVMQEKLVAVENSLFVAESNAPESHEIRELENLLKSYSNILAEKQTVLSAKQSEKTLLEEHLLQLNQFAQDYLQQQQQQQNQNQEGGVVEEDAQAESDFQQDSQLLYVQEGQKHHIPKQLQTAYGMECIQSLSEQEQDSQGSPHLETWVLNAALSNAQQQSHQQMTSQSSSRVPTHEISLPDARANTQNSSTGQKSKQASKNDVRVHNNNSIQIESRSQKPLQTGGQEIYTQDDFQAGEVNGRALSNNNHPQQQFGVSSPTESDQLNTEKYQLPLNYDSGSFGGIRSNDAQQETIESVQPASPQQQQHQQQVQLDAQQDQQLDQNSSFGGGDGIKQQNHYSSFGGGQETETNNQLDDKQSAIAKALEEGDGIDTSQLRQFLQDQSDIESSQNAGAGAISEDRPLALNEQEMNSFLNKSGQSVDSQKHRIQIQTQIQTKLNYAEVLMQAKQKFNANSPTNQ